jgi:phosphocarrier protein
MRNQSEQKEPRTATREITIVNELGLHARPAAEFVRCASQFRSDVFIVTNGKRLSAASMLEVLMADLNQGESAILEAHGVDAEAAVERLAELVHGFRD